MSTSSSPTPPDTSFVCACKDYHRSACRKETFYKKHDGKSYCVLHYPGTEKTEDFQKVLKQKLHDEDYDFQEVWFPDRVYFTNVTFSAVANFSGATFTNSNFDGAQFSEEANFIYATFGKETYFRNTRFSANVDFSNAIFMSDAHFLDAQFSATASFIDTRFRATTNFDKAQFNADAYFFDTGFFDVYFNKAKFSAVADFTNVKFNAYADFNSAQFNAIADFSKAEFSANVSFINAVFNAPVKFHTTKFLAINSSRGGRATAAGNAFKADTEAVEVTFAGTTFRDVVSFEWNEFAERIFMTFAAATFEKPERATCHDTRLRPHWFVKVDSRKFTFINVHWGFLNRRGAIHREIEALIKSNNGPLMHHLDSTFRQLAVNAEENNRYEEAANFRYMAMEMRQLLRWRRVDLFRLSWWYWLLSGYGERVTRAFGALLTIWLLFAIIYWTGNATWWQSKQSARLAAAESNAGEKSPPAVAPLTLPEAIIYSAGVMTLQKPEPLPANKRAKAFVLLETVLGPLQAALLALAIRRKFMR